MLATEEARKPRAIGCKEPLQLFLIEHFLPISSLARATTYGEEMTTRCVSLYRQTHHHHPQLHLHNLDFARSDSSHI
jgi:hypothetical protein